MACSYHLSLTSSFAAAIITPAARGRHLMTQIWVVISCTHFLACEDGLLISRVTALWHLSQELLF